MTFRTDHSFSRPTTHYIGSIGTGSDEQGPDVRCEGCYVAAGAGNGGQVFVGTEDGVTATTGFQLTAGQISPLLHISNLNEVFVIGNSGTSSVSILALH